MKLTEICCALIFILALPLGIFCINKTKSDNNQTTQAHQAILQLQWETNAQVEKLVVSLDYALKENVELKQNVKDLEWMIEGIIE